MSEDLKSFNLKAPMPIHTQLQELAREKKVSVTSLYIEGAKKLVLNNNDTKLDTYHTKFYNENIERAILSAVMFDPAILDDMQLKIKKDDFYKPFHQAIYESYISLHQKELPIDEEFVKKVLVDRGQWIENEFLEILACNPITNTSHYVDTILEYSIKRKMNIFLLRARNDLIEKDESAFLLKDNLRNSLENFEDNRKSIVSPVSITEIEEEEIEFYIKDWLPIPKKAITIIGGSGGSAKSAITLQALMRMAVENPKLKIFAWLSEDLKGYSKQRFNHFKDTFFRNEKESTFNNLAIAGNDTIPFFLLDVSSKGINVNEKFYQFKNDVKDYDVIVLDPLIAFFGGEENSNTHARAFMNELNEWVAKENKTLILIHHSKKSNKEGRDDANIRGAGAIVDASRLTYEIKSVSEEDYKSDYRLFTGNKFNSILSTDEAEIKDAIMSHRKTLIAKDNLGVQMLFKNKCNKSTMFYLKAWGENSNFTIEYEDCDIPKQLMDGNKLPDVELHFGDIPSERN